MATNNPGYVRAITPGNTPLSKTLEFILVGTDGTVTFENCDGTTASGVPVVAGTQLDIQAHKITAATASLFGVYRS